MNEYRMTVTKIEDIERNKKRVKIFFDNNYYSQLKKELVAVNGIEIGSTFLKKDFDLIMIESEQQFALDKLLNYITKSMKTYNECKNFLYEKCFNSVIVSNVLLKVKSFGYIDDRKYAEMYIDLHNSDRGKKRLENELKLKGIDNSIIKELLESKTDYATDYKNALRIAEKYKKQSNLDKKTREKLIRALYSKGYEWEIIGKVLSELGIREKEDEDF